MNISSSVKADNYTATADSAFSLISNDLWFIECNIHINTNAAKYGDSYSQDQTANVGDLIIKRNFNLKDLYFKNASPGSHTKISYIGTLMTEQYRRSILGI